MVEVRWIDDDSEDVFPAFIRGVKNIPGATILPVASGGQPLGAMVAGIGENTHWVQIEGPPTQLMVALIALRQLCDETFPRVGSED
ncbi:MAG: hypothetical protein M3P83_10710 [Actinomycetota bacterium]|nr:hypothetical protein [Actinomycetota bacterium]